MPALALVSAVNSMERISVDAQARHKLLAATFNTSTTCNVCNKILGSSSGVKCMLCPFQSHKYCARANEATLICGKDIHYATIAAPIASYSSIEDDDDEVFGAQDVHEYLGQVKSGREVAHEFAQHVIVQPVKCDLCEFRVFASATKCKNCKTVAHEHCSHELSKYSCNENKDAAKKVKALSSFLGLMKSFFERNGALALAVDPWSVYALSRYQRKLKRRIIYDPPTQKLYDSKLVNQLVGGADAMSWALNPLSPSPSPPTTTALSADQWKVVVHPVTGLEVFMNGITGKTILVWQEATDAAGNTYLYHVQTGETRYPTVKTPVGGTPKTPKTPRLLTSPVSAEGQKTKKINAFEKDSNIPVDGRQVQTIWNTKPGEVLRLQEVDDAALITMLTAGMVYSLAAYGHAAYTGALDNCMRGFVAVTVEKSTSHKLNVDENTRAVCDMSGIPLEDIIYTNWKVSTFGPCWFVARDRLRKWLVVSVRGTLNVRDLLTDFAATPEPFLGKHYAHGGMVKCAEAIFPELLDILKKELAPGGASAGYKVVVTGHSLGGGVAALLSILLKADASFPYPIQGLVYASPSVVSRDLSLASTHIITVNYRNDMVPRFSASNFQRLKDDLEAFSLKNRTIRAFMGSKEKVAKHRFEAMKENRDLGGPAVNYSAGIVYNIDILDRAQPDTSKEGKWQIRQPIMARFEPEAYSHLIASPTFFSDHLPGKYMRVLHALCKEYGI